MRVPWESPGVPAPSSRRRSWRKPNVEISRESARFPRGSFESRWAFEPMAKSGRPTASNASTSDQPNGRSSALRMTNSSRACLMPSLYPAPIPFEVVSSERTSGLPSTAGATRASTRARSSSVSGRGAPLARRVPRPPRAPARRWRAARSGRSETAGRASSPRRAKAQSALASAAAASSHSAAVIP